MSNSGDIEDTKTAINALFCAFSFRKSKKGEIYWISVIDELRDQQEIFESGGVDPNDI